MTNTYWRKQEPGKPLFPELEWSRPESRAFAGKLAIIGGNLHGFALPAEAYTEATKTGVGAARVLLPLSVRRLVENFIPGLDYAAANPSGSFGQQALGAWLDIASWADATLIAGDLGRNSETAIIFEKFLNKHRGQLTITKDAANYAINLAKTTINRPETLLVISLSQLQKLFIKSGSTTPITLDMGLVQLIEALHVFTAKHPAFIITKYQDQMIAAVNGQISTTRLTKEAKIWQAKTAAQAAVWWLQNPQKPFEALTTSLHNL